MGDDRLKRAQNEVDTYPFSYYSFILNNTSTNYYFKEYFAYYKIKTKYSDSPYLYCTVEQPFIFRCLLIGQDTLPLTPGHFYMATG